MGACVRPCMYHEETFYQTQNKTEKMIIRVSINNSVNPFRFLGATQHMHEWGGAGRGVDRKKHCTVHLLTPYSHRNHDHEIKNV